MFQKLTLYINTVILIITGVLGPIFFTVVAIIRVVTVRYSALVSFDCCYLLRMLSTALISSI